jgi:hypothetical protein
LVVFGAIFAPPLFTGQFRRSLTNADTRGITRGKSYHNILLCKQITCIIGHLMTWHDALLRADMTISCRSKKKPLHVLKGIIKGISLSGIDSTI